jgi:hypothetical protein
MYSLVGVNWHSYEGTTRWHLPHLAAASPEPWHRSLSKPRHTLASIKKIIGVWVSVRKGRSLLKSSCDVTPILPNLNIMAVSMHAQLAASPGLQASSLSIAACFKKRL